MPIFRTSLLAAAVASLGGCYVFSIPDAVPDVPKQTVPESAFIDIDSRIVTETRTGMVKTGEVCSGGDCTSIREKKTRQVDVKVATATIGGGPVSIGAIAMSNPEFRSDDEQVRSDRRRCLGGHVSMTLGGIGVLAGAVMLRQGFYKDDDHPGGNRSLAIGGYAALGAGVALLAGGYFLGGNRCDEYEAAMTKWASVYEEPSDSEVRGDERAAMMEKLVADFNKAHAATAQKTPTSDDTSTEEVTP
ncbi:MAG TPA: hypothetical protein VGM39_00265 [Kofleriaceae bacterium]|jgi:hypothetical protein